MADKRLCLEGLVRPGGVALLSHLSFGFRVNGVLGKPTLSSHSFPTTLRLLLPSCGHPLHASHTLRLLASLTLRTLFHSNTHCVRNGRTFSATHSRQPLLCTVASCCIKQSTLSTVPFVQECRMAGRIGVLCAWTLRQTAQTGAVYVYYRRNYTSCHIEGHSHAQSQDTVRVRSLTTVGIGAFQEGGLGVSDRLCDLGTE